MNREKKRITRRLALAFGADWKNLSPEVKEHCVNKYQKIIAAKRVDPDTLLRRVFEEKGMAFGLFFLGLFFGVVGSLIANVVEDFVKYGDRDFGYLVFVLVMTLIFVLAANWLFESVTNEDLRHGKLLESLLEGAPVSQDNDPAKEGEVQNLNPIP